MDTPRHQAPTLIVRGGRDDGTRFELPLPTSTLGKAAGCDVPVVGDRVAPVHAFLTVSGGALTLRCWPGVQSLVNGRATSGQELCQGDRLRIGDTAFEVRWVSPSEQLTQRERDLAVREREIDAGRERLLRLRRLFIARWKRHWKTRRLETDGQTAALRAEKARFERFREQFHTQAELEKGRLAEQADALESRRSRWLADIESRERALESLRVELDRRTEILGQAELQAESSRVELRRECERLRAEADGLEKRVSNAREALSRTTGCDPAGIPTAIPAEFGAWDESAAPERPGDDRESRIVLIVEDLDAQRAMLADQFAAMKTVERESRSDLERMLAEVEAFVANLARREARLKTVEMSLSRALREVEAARGSFEARSARLATSETDYRSWADRTEVELSRRESAVRRREDALDEMCRRWATRRGEEVRDLRAELRLCEQAREGYLAAARAAEVKAVEANLELQDLAQRALMLERIKGKVIEASADPSEAEREIARSERRLTAARARAAKQLNSAREKLESERRDLDARFTELAGLSLRVTESRRDLSDRLAAFERESYLDARSAEERDALIAVHSAERGAYERQLAELRGEIERIASLLIDRPDEDIARLSAA